MSPSLNIALLGASGTMGPFILQAISAHPNVSNVCVRILVRPTSVGKVEILAEKHTDLDLTVHVIDYTSEWSRTRRSASGCGCCHLVQSETIPGSRRRTFKHTGLLPGFIAQDTVAKAAKLPAPTHSIPLDSESYIIGKRHHHDFLRELGLPFVLVYSGTFTETEPPSTPLPPQSTEAPIPLGEPPFETTRYHLRPTSGTYVLRGLRRDEGLVSEMGKTQWVLDLFPDLRNL
ncbi:hypothetical protein C8F04DRAFT_1088653 [Mycena alexandri]|uniref:NmrA-like domain-containing protein n=1 Tax=Mycena alexandri TaxID=1745969 RepID=A0AAD6T3D0_9AGAR|nr:hypothetical protein C8F04DRAFT_1088653 [Mycena alexandri]